jgi:hypothetical protein
MNLFNETLKLGNLLLHNYDQAITSAKTCRRITAYGTTVIADFYPAGVTVLDFGGGKFDDAKNYLSDYGIVCEIYDPYNQEFEKNVKVLSKKYDVLLCNNVLNTLTDDVLEFVIQDMVLVMKHCKIKTGFVTVYERNKNGKGEITGEDQYQRNEKTNEYIKPLSKYFNTVKLQKKVICVEGIKL